MIKSILVCYLLKLNKGSEWLLGENALLNLQRGQYIVTAGHQLGEALWDGKIGSVRYKRRHGRICVVGIYGARTEPLRPIQFRIDYFIWCLRVYRLLIKRVSRVKVRHINFAQVLSPIPWDVIRSPNFTFGPVGGQGPWYKSKFLPKRYRIANFVLFKMVYSAFTKRMLSTRVVFVHPTLRERFKCGVVEPAVKLPHAPEPNFKKKRQVLHVSRNVYFKLPDLHRELFDRLSKLHPEVNFVIAGPGWGHYLGGRNLQFIDALSRGEILQLFSESAFHINLSLELAGIVNLEAAANGCVTVGSKNSGAEFLLKLRGNYVVDLYDPEITIEDIVQQIASVIHTYDEFEAYRQYEHGKLHAFVPH